MAAGAGLRRSFMAGAIAPQCAATLPHASPDAADLALYHDPHETRLGNTTSDRIGAAGFRSGSCGLKSGSPVHARKRWSVNCVPSATHLRPERLYWATKGSHDEHRMNVECVLPVSPRQDARGLRGTRRKRDGVPTPHTRVAVGGACRSNPRDRCLRRWVRLVFGWSYEGCGMNAGTFDKGTLPGGRMTAGAAVTADAVACGRTSCRANREIVKIDGNQKVVDLISSPISCISGFASRKRSPAPGQVIGIPVSLPLGGTSIAGDSVPLASPHGTPGREADVKEFANGRITGKALAGPDRSGAFGRIRSPGRARACMRGTPAGGKAEVVCYADH